MVKNAIFCPILSVCIIPLLIFVSLFFIPDDYSGLSKFSQTMQDLYKNKCLFDLLGLYTISIFALSFMRYLFLVYLKMSKM